MGTTKNFHLVALPILSFLWLAIGRRNNIFRQETLPLIHFCLLQHTSQEDAFTQNEHLDDESFASLVSPSEEIAESTVSGAIVGSITSISVVVGASCEKRML